MKHRFIAPLVLLFSMLLWNDSRAHCNIATAHTASASDATDLYMSSVDPYIDIRVCVNAGPISVCITLRCDLSWYDLLQPGLGQLLGHDGCKPLIGQITGPGQSSLQFSGTAEDMIQTIEAAMKIPKGTLQNLTATNSPAFPLPDGKEYRVVAKTYPVLQGTTGRYLPLELEVVK